MPKVYVVLWQQFDETGITAIFTSEPEADAYTKLLTDKTPKEKYISFFVEPHNLYNSEAEAQAEQAK